MALPSNVRGKLPRFISSQIMRDLLAPGREVAVVVMVNEPLGFFQSHSSENGRTVTNLGTLWPGLLRSAPIQNSLSHLGRKKKGWKLMLIET